MCIWSFGPDNAGSRVGCTCDGKCTVQEGGCNFTELLVNRMLANYLYMCCNSALLNAACVTIQINGYTFKHARGPSLCVQSKMN